jgi:hypothetical protein
MILIIRVHPLVLVEPVLLIIFEFAVVLFALFVHSWLPFGYPTKTRGWTRIISIIYVPNRMNCFKTMRTCTRHLLSFKMYLVSTSESFQGSNPQNCFARPQVVNRRNPLGGAVINYICIACHLYFMWLTRLNRTGKTWNSYQWKGYQKIFVSVSNLT